MQLGLSHENKWLNLTDTNNNWAASWQNQQNDCAQWRLRSDWPSAQFDQSLHCALNG